MFNTCAQNSRAIVSTLTDLFRRLKQEDQSISKAYMRCDNAGCYHGAQTLLSVKKLQEETNIRACRFDFCEAQTRKSPCGRMAATVKATIRPHINEHNNCTTSGEFVVAAKSVPYLSVFACEMSPNTVIQPKVEWEGITRYNNMLFEPEAVQIKLSGSTTINEQHNMVVTTWRAFDIGPGKNFLWSKLKTISSIDPCKVVFSHTNDGWKSDSIIKYRSGNLCHHFLENAIAN